WSTAWDSVLLYHSAAAPAANTCTMEMRRVKISNPNREFCMTLCRFYLRARLARAVFSKEEPAPMSLALPNLPVECVARHVGVPVHERAGGIVLPGPDMQCVERR